MNDENEGLHDHLGNNSDRLRELITKAESRSKFAYNSAEVLLEIFCRDVQRGITPPSPILAYLCRAFTKALNENKPINTTLGLKRRRGQPEASGKRTMHVALTIKKLMLGCFTSADLEQSTVILPSYRESGQFHLHIEKQHTYRDACTAVADATGLTTKRIEAMYTEVRKITPELADCTSPEELQARLAGYIFLAPAKLPPRKTLPPN